MKRRSTPIYSYTYNIIDKSVYERHESHCRGLLFLYCSPIGAKTSWCLPWGTWSAIFSRALRTFLNIRPWLQGKTSSLGWLRWHPRIRTFVFSLMSCCPTECQNVLERCKHVDIRFTIIGPQHVCTLASMIQYRSFVLFWRVWIDIYAMFPGIASSERLTVYCSWLIKCVCVVWYGLIYYG